MLQQSFSPAVLRELEFVLTFELVTKYTTANGP